MAKKKVFSIGTSLAEGLEQTIAAAHNHAGDLRVEAIPIHRITLDLENPREFALDLVDLYEGIAEADPYRERKLRELASLQTLSHSIKDQGLIHPIIVYKKDNGYQLIAGERRTLASILANKSDIQAKVLESKPSALKISLLQWIENIERSDLTLWERLKNLEKIIQAFAEKNNLTIDKVGATDISQLIGCAKSHAANLKSVLNADNTLKNLIAKNQIKNLEKAALIAGIKSPVLREQAISECVAGMPLKKLKVFSEQGEKTKVQFKPLERRGRQAENVKLGSTKNILVAKFILDSILRNASLSHISPYFKNIDANNYRALSDTFKNLLKKLEELHTEKKNYV